MITSKSRGGRYNPSAPIPPPPPLCRALLVAVAARLPPLPSPLGGPGWAHGGPDWRGGPPGPPGPPGSNGRAGPGHAGLDLRGNGLLPAAAAQLRAAAPAAAEVLA